MRMYYFYKQALHSVQHRDSHKSPSQQTPALGASWRSGCAGDFAATPTDSAGRVLACLDVALKIQKIRLLELEFLEGETIEVGRWRLMIQDAERAVRTITWRR